MANENKNVELKDEELEKVSGGDNTQTAQSLIEKFKTQVYQNSLTSFPTSKNQDVSIEFKVPEGRKG